MEGLQNLLIFVGLAFLAAVSALKCNTDNEQTVVCANPGNKDIVLRRGVVSDNNKIIRIMLQRCRIVELDFEAFENDYNLKHIDLAENKISHLPLGVLDGNKQVTYLNLSHNLLTSFPLGLFDEKVGIEVLDLKGNMLEYLELGIFDTLQDLIYVDLSGNALLGKNMSQHIFDQSSKIKYMDFSRNNMSGASDMLLHAFKELTYLKLDRCSLSEVPIFATKSNLRTIVQLVLSNNRIVNLSNGRTFRNLESLEILNLADNIINEIHEDFFVCCALKLKMIVLRNNRIKTLPEGLFRNMVNLGNLDLSRNFISYVPLNTFRETKLKNLNLSYNRFTYLEANFCLELKNSGVTLNKFYINDNPWQCACFIEVLKEMKMNNIRYNNNKLNGVNPICVTTEDFHCKRQPADNDFYLQKYISEIRSN